MFLGHTRYVVVRKKMSSTGSYILILGTVLVELFENKKDTVVIISTDIQTHLLLFHILELFLVLYRELPCLHFHFLRIVLKTFSPIFRCAPRYVYTVFSLTFCEGMPNKGPSFSSPHQQCPSYDFSFPTHIIAIKWCDFFSSMMFIYIQLIFIT